MSEKVKGKVSVSVGNIKMGKIPSVSLPAGVTCRCDCGCYSKCYAAKIERLRPNVKKCYQKNLDLLLNDPQTFWREVEAAIMMSRYFRFHVSGDIPNEDYLDHMIEICRRQKHCQVLCFTKKFDIVNKKLAEMEKNGEVLPENLHLIFSGWKGLKMENPYKLPEAHVRFKDGTTTARPGAKKCGGNCTNCALTETGCWTIGRGEQVEFNEH